MQIKAAGHSHVGMKRSENQDSFLVASDLNLYVVADGMGGHKGGQTASRIAIQTMSDYFSSDACDGIDAKERVPQAILAANAAVQSKSKADASLHGMGTTTTAIYVNDNKLLIGHVGDSRAYLIHPGKIWQLTQDHSLVQEKLKAGIITRAQLKSDRMKNVITRSVGIDSEVVVDAYQLEIHPGDVFLICSDGLSGMVEDREILDIVEECAIKRNDVDLAARKLIETANENGGDDNVTAIVVRII